MKTKTTQNNNENNNNNKNKNKNKWIWGLFCNILRNIEVLVGLIIRTEIDPRKAYSC